MKANVSQAHDGVSFLSSGVKPFCVCRRDCTGTRIPAVCFAWHCEALEVDESASVLAEVQMHCNFMLGCLNHPFDGFGWYATRSCAGTDGQSWIGLGGFQGC